MTLEEFMEEVDSFADLYLTDYARKFSIGYSEDEDGIFSADITITMMDDSTWIVPITQDEDGDVVVQAGEESTLALSPESVYAVMWFEAMDHMEQQKDALVKLACLGNGDRYGNSEGNDIAIRALGLVPGEVHNQKP